METPILNSHNKLEFEPAHSSEHILNATMVKMFGCPRSRNAHIEKKKVIGQNLDVTVEFVTREEAAKIVDLSKLPEDASETLRIVRIGDYDACACIGAHVGNTSEIGVFKIISHSYENGIWRLRWKVVR